MIKKISISNFYSIGETQELSFEVTSKDIMDDSARKIPKTKEALNFVTCLIGHNASGKTNVLKAITFIFWLINHSYNNKIQGADKLPYYPHEMMKGKSSKIVLEFFNKHDFYEYSIEFNRDKILKERLRKKIERMNVIFELDRSHKEANIKSSNIKINKTDEVRFKGLQKVALLSSLIDTGYLPEIICFKNFESNVSQWGRAPDGLMMPVLLKNISQTMFENKELSGEVLGFFKNIDLGITDFQFGTANGGPMLECVHETKDGNFILPIFQESNGTQHSLVLSSKIKSILKKGGIFIADEIESGLHPHVIKKLIWLFENKKTNPHNAQLIFSTHQHLLLNDRSKTQIFIAEKTEDTLETEVYRLDDVDGVRNDENYFQKYIAGAYGGSPRFHWI